MLYIYQIDKFEYKYPDPEDLEEILGYPFVLDENYKIQCETLQDFRMFAKLITYQVNQLTKAFDKQYAEVFDDDYREALVDEHLLKHGLLTDSAEKKVLENKRNKAIKIPSSFD